MYTPISENDLDFVNRCVLNGFTEEQAWDLLRDYHQGFVAEYQEMEEDDRED